MDCNSVSTSGSISVPAGANRSLSSASVDSAILKRFWVSNVVVVESVDFGTRSRENASSRVFA